MPAKTGFSQRPKQVAKGAIAQEVQALVRDFEAYLRLRITARTDGVRKLVARLERLIDGDEIVLLHALDDLVHKFIHLAFFAYAIEQLLHVFVKNLSIFERLLD